MTPAKAFYETYLADDNIAEINKVLAHEVLVLGPNHVFEFGCGTGKNLKLIQKMQTSYAKANIVTAGIDLSFLNITHAIVKNNQKFVSIGDESHLGYYSNFDVVFTCSVLDHIEDIDKIISNFKRMAKTVILAETNDVPADYYYPHNYEQYGFKKTNFNWTGEDGAEYFIWKWSDTINVSQDSSNDDLAR
jgi:2-polyprenyl-3-methyl-5-hydroxy-6-metoxy-1,4-benzoquinol methylase